MTRTTPLPQATLSSHTQTIREQSYRECANLPVDTGCNEKACGTKPYVPGGLVESGSTGSFLGLETSPTPVLKNQNLHASRFPDDSNMQQSLGCHETPPPHTHCELYFSVWQIILGFILESWGEGEIPQTPDAWSSMPIGGNRTPG